MARSRCSGPTTVAPSACASERAELTTSRTSRLTGSGPSRALAMPGADCRNRRWAAWRLMSKARATSLYERPLASARAACWRSNASSSSRSRLSVRSADSPSGALAASFARRQIRCPDIDTAAFKSLPFDRRRMGSEPDNPPDGRRLATCVNPA